MYVLFLLKFTLFLLTEFILKLGFGMSITKSKLYSSLLVSRLKFVMENACPAFSSLRSLFFSSKIHLETWLWDEWKKLLSRNLILLTTFRLYR
jgi:hypothetical protein